MLSPIGSFVRQERARRLRREIKDQKEFYSTVRNPTEIRAWQLAAFNSLWKVTATAIPFYAELLRAGRVPAQFRSWDEFRESVPIIERATVQQRGSDLRNPTLRSDFIRTTGGSTGQPIQLPAWNCETLQANRDFWFTRSWFGIEPSDRLFSIWGHSHQLGYGFRGRFNAIRRNLKDALLGYLRWPAYDLSDNAMLRAGDALLKFRPAWMLGYSVALERFARVNGFRAQAFRRLKLKAVVATAEAFSSADSAARIEAMLRCPIAMEYGAVETGVIAHQRRDGLFQILWRHWFVETIPSISQPGRFEMLLTSLYPRSFPLLRYRIGDLISDDANNSDFNQTFSRVIGRCNDALTLADGTLIHSEAFTHAIKECPSIDSFQVIQRESGSIELRYLARAAMSTAETEIRRRLRKIHPHLANVELVRGETLLHTMGGKTPTILNERPNA